MYAGEVDEEKILNMPYVMYSGLIKEIGLMLNYQAVSNLMGNSFAGEDGMNAVNESNPMLYIEENKHKKITMEDILNSPLMNNQ